MTLVNDVLPQDQSFSSRQAQRDGKSAFLQQNSGVLFAFRGDHNLQLKALRDDRIGLDNLLSDQTCRRTSANIPQCRTKSISLLIQTVALEAARARRMTKQDFTPTGITFR